MPANHGNWTKAINAAKSSLTRLETTNILKFFSALFFIAAIIEYFFHEPFAGMSYKLALWISFSIICLMIPKPDQLKRISLPGGVEFEAFSNDDQGNSQKVRDNFFNFVMKSTGLHEDKTNKGYWFRDALGKQVTRAKLNITEEVVTIRFPANFFERPFIIVDNDDFEVIQRSIAQDSFQIRRIAPAPASTIVRYLAIGNWM